MFIIPQISNIDDWHTMFTCNIGDTNKQKKVITMNQHLLGNPKLTVTHVNEVKTGINHIVVDSVQWKSRNDYGKRCHCGNARWRKIIY